MSCFNFTVLPENSSVEAIEITRVFWCRCSRNRNHIAIITIAFIFSLVLLPALLYILHQGCQQWRAQRLLPAAPLMNLTDIQTYHSIILQISNTVGLFIYVCGSVLQEVHMIVGGSTFSSIISFGQDFTNLTVCVLHYMAVVHPVHYLALKQSWSVQSCAHLVAWVGVLSGTFYFVGQIILELNSNFFVCMSGLFCVIVNFCCVSVVCALKRPRPGAAGGDQDRDAQFKRRAIHTITVIMAALLIKFSGSFLSSALFSFRVFDISQTCDAYLSYLLLVLPSNWVLPLLYLHRTEKLSCLQKTPEQ